MLRSTSGMCRLCYNKDNLYSDENWERPGEHNQPFGIYLDVWACSTNPWHHINLEEQSEWQSHKKQKD